MEFKISSGVQPTPVKVVLYGPEGIGKTTFASQFPDALFIDTEESTKMLNVRRFDKPKTWADVLGMVAAVVSNPTICKTLVIDTADWAERLCEQYVCTRGKVDSIEGFGYGKGYTMVGEEFAKLLDALTTVTTKGVNVVLTAHSMIRKFERPDEAGAYDRYELKLGNKAGNRCAAAVKEWCDLLLFANYKEIVSEVGGKKKAYGGQRVMYTTHHPCWDAKNRFDLKDELPFDYQQIADCIFADGADGADDAKTSTQPTQTTPPTANDFDAQPVSKEESKVCDDLTAPPEHADESKQSATKQPKDNAPTLSTLQKKVAANAKKQGVDVKMLEAWAVRAGCLPNDKDKYAATGGVPTLADWPDDFINQVIIPHWKDVIKAANVPF